jgi:transposase
MPKDQLTSSYTVGVDVGDRHSHLCLLDTQSGEVVEESRIATNPAAFERRFSGFERMRVAIETGTHSPWLSRVLEGCGHEVLVANARKLRLIYAEAARTTASTPRTWHAWPASTLACSRRSSTAGRPRRPTWR